MSPSHHHYLALMGIQVWQEKQLFPLSSAQQKEDLSSLCAKVTACPACDQHKTRTQTISGVGNPNADLIIITDTPDFYEDPQSQPWQLLDQMLHSIGLNRQTVYITTLSKCPSPDNHLSLQNEIHQCKAFITQQLSLINPKAILVLGQTAAQHLLNTETPLELLRGKPHLTYIHIPLVATYHPAHLLLNPQNKSRAWEDLQLIYKLLESEPAKTTL